MIIRVHLEYLEERKGSVVSSCNLQHQQSHDFDPTDFHLPISLMIKALEILVQSQFWYCITLALGAHHIGGQMVFA